MKLSDIVRRIGGTDPSGNADLPMALLCASAFSVAFSLPLGRIFAALCLLALMARAIRRHTPILFPRAAWLVVLFAILATATILQGPAPEVGLGKLDKLAWFLTIPLAATLARGHHRATRLLTSFSLGAGVLALDICIRHPLQAMASANRLAAAGKPADFLWELTTLGGMTDGQLLGMAVLVSATLFLGLRGRLRWAAALLLGLHLLALVLNFKRGSWMAMAVTAGILLLLRTNWRVTLALFLLGLTTLFLPPVQSRLTDLRTELSDTKGGRLVMWTRIAPELRRQYPAGIGFRSLTEELMQQTAASLGVTVEKDRNHLHNNLIQVTVDMGYAGLLLYLIWMGQGLADGLRWYRRTGRSKAHAAEQATALCSLLMLVLLLLNGLVEYNLADAELVLVYGMLFGLLAAHARNPEPTSPVP